MAKAEAVARKRVDPKPRSVLGGLDHRVAFKPGTKDPNKHYVLATEQGGQDVDYFMMLGYKPTIASRDGVLPGRGEWKPEELGKPIKNVGHVLMEMDLADRQQIEEYGVDGQTGQSLADKIEERVIDKRVGVDLSRNIGRRTPYAFVEPNRGHNTHVPDPGPDSEE